MKNDAAQDPKRALNGVIVTHARLAAALRDAVERVAGAVASLETVSNDGLGAVEVQAAVVEAVQRRGGDCIVFVDSRGGSCAVACVEALRHEPNVRVISGVNLPMSVDFVLRREDYALDVMCARLVQRGRDAVKQLTGNPEAGS